MDTLDEAIATQNIQELTSVKTKQSGHGLAHTSISTVDWCGTPLRRLQLVVEDTYGPSPVVSNSVVMLRAGYGVLKLRLASQQRQPNDMDTLDVIITIRGIQELTKLKTNNCLT